MEEPVKFRLMENPEECIDVEIVFLIAMADPKEQIHLLPKLMSVFKNKDLLTKIKEARSESDLEEIVSKTLL